MKFLKKLNIGGKKQEKGFVLLISLVITLAVGLATVGLVGLTLQEYRLSVRSSAYSKALRAAESGVNLACEALVANNGWSANWSSSGSLTNSGSVISSYSVSGVPSGSDSYVITSTGQVSLVDRTIQRIVRVTVEKTADNNPQFKYGILSKAAIRMGGSVKADSYNSTNSAQSTNGQYDPAKATRNATLATLTTDDPAIQVSGGAQLDGIGTLSVIEGARVDIPKWFPHYSGTITYDAGQDIVEVAVPFSGSPSGTINVGPWPNQAQTIAVNGSQDMSLESFKVTASGALTITGSGTLRIYVDGKTQVSGSGKIQIIPSPSTANLKVEIYANDDVSIAGSGVLNNTYRAANCSIWGTENCTSVKVTGNSGYIGTIYAPEADIDLSGSSFAMGAFLGGSVDFTGNTRFYIDESLIGGASSSSSGSAKPYNLTGWVEL
jgi:Tfp pilus assembly protein PilX